MKKEYYSSLIPELTRRSKAGFDALFSINNPALSEFLKDQFESGFGLKSNFVGDPVFEATFGWKTNHAIRLQDLENKIFTKELIKVLDESGDLPKTSHPYLHQIETWSLLKEEKPQSIVVSSGTGSGKTECFMLPVIDTLIKKNVVANNRQQGVKAIMLYPLNALINSQKERLHKWTKSFGDKVTFGLYNGLTKESVRSSTKREKPNQILDRTDMRSNPPDILVTNPTMLEYILVRNEDNALLENSANSLEWIILDEAHSYIGSQAAEMALLIRRVLNAFGKKPDEIRFVATSATIGSKEGKSQLATFLSELSGVPKENVHVVTGEREVPDRIQIQSLMNTLSVDDIFNTQEDDNHNALVLNSRIANSIRNEFISAPNHVLSLQDLVSIAQTDNNQKVETQKIVLKWLDLLSLSKAHTNDGAPFLPLRCHVFHRTLSGLWACADSNCKEKNKTSLSKSEWPFGMVYTQPVKKCSCGSPNYELHTCSDCGEISLLANDKNGKLIQHVSNFEIDEFKLDNEPDEDVNENKDKADSGKRVLLLGKLYKSSEKRFLEKNDQRLLRLESENTIPVIVNNCEYNSGVVSGCARCKEINSSVKVKQVSFRVGAPYLLSGIIPTTLDYAEEIDKKKYEKPYFGKRMLSFTDSRQGTARLAAKLQQDSEKNYSRGLIYHTIAQLQKETNQSDADDQFLNKYAHLLTNEGLELYRNEKNSSVKAVSFSDLIYRLKKQGGDFELLKQKYYDLNRSLFDKDGDALPELIFLRELARRPSRQINLESLGLIQLELNNLKEESAPNIWNSYPDLKGNWVTFLQFVFNYFMRSAGGFDTKHIDQVRHWVGAPLYQMNFAEPDQKDTKLRQRRWLNTDTGRHNSNVINYLAKLIHANLESQEDRNKIDEVLANVFYAYKKSGVFSYKDQGVIIDYDKQLGLSIPTNISFCPLTRRFVPYVINGMSPYTPIASEKPILCETVEMPVYSNYFESSTDDETRVLKATEWLRNTKEVRDLRALNKWGVNHDNVISFKKLFKTKEHSAQQSSHKLDEYEKEFKSGDINVLSCSTTMEMGIDIGGIQLVTMTNVPPHPANYLQRAGRAGRRKESRATSVTLCKDNPHDFNVFTNPKWPFITQLPAPKVSLNSLTIIQRHINAVLLTHFLKSTVVDQKLIKLTTGWFFLDSPTNCQKFQTWVSETIDLNSYSKVALDIRQVLKNTPFEYTGIGGFIQNTMDALSKIEEEWQLEYNEFSNQIESLKKEDPSNKGIKALEIQKRRLEQEYLLRELSAKGILPGYGFPSDIVSFDSSNVVEWVKSKEDESDRIDNKYLNKELPNRDAVTALREYAPGSDVIIDGLVYKSAGITLNWHKPVNKVQAKEPLNLKWAWRCSNCGSSGVETFKSNTISCRTCDSKIEYKELFQYIDPSGYTVDFNIPPHNDITRQDFIPIETPIASVNTEWLNLSNPKLGRFRIDNDASILYHASGVNRNGYAICLTCGRAEPMNEKGEIPKALKDEHQSLKPRKKGTICSGSHNDFAIKSDIHLGHNIRTSALEFEFKDLDGNWLNNDSIAHSFAVVLRYAMSRKIGVETAEIDLVVQPKRDNSIKRVAITLFDKNNAGYAEAALPLINDIIRDAAKHLVCDCDAYCSKCLLDYDQRFYIEKLDRVQCLSFFDDMWIKSLETPEDLKYFGIDTEVVSQNIFSELRLLAHSKAHGDLEVYFDQPISNDWSFDKFDHLLKTFAKKEFRIKIILKKQVFEQLDTLEQLQFIGYQSLGASIFLSTNTPIVGDRSTPLIATFSSDKHISFALDSGATFSSSEEKILSSIVLSSTTFKASKNYDRLDGSKLLSQLNDNNTKSNLISIYDELDGNVLDFGKKFWSLVLNEFPSFKDEFKGDVKINEVVYTDKYIRTPHTAAMILKIIEELRHIAKNDWRIIFDMQPYESSNFYSNKVFHQWVDSNSRDEVLVKTLHKIGISAKVENDFDNKSAHWRLLSINLSNGKEIIIWLDQGVGFWTVSRSRNRNQSLLIWNFDDTIEEQVETLLKCSHQIEGDETGTFIGVKIID